MGTNDYKVKIKDKLKVYHANLLKKYIEREEELQKAATAIAEGLMTNVTCNGESCEPELSPDIDDDSDFLEIGGYVAKESIADVKTGHGLSDTERTEFLDLAQEFSSLFTDTPGTTTSIISTSRPVSPSGQSYSLFRTA